MKPLSFYDCMSIVIFWMAAGFVIVEARDPVISLVAVCSAYYLSKWVIKRKVEE
jgi:hypothetical protein